LKATEKRAKPSSKLDLYTEYLPAHSTEKHLHFFSCFQASRYNTGKTDQSDCADSHPKQGILQARVMSQKGKVNRGLQRATWGSTKKTCRLNGSGSTTQGFDGMTHLAINF